MDKKLSRRESLKVLSLVSASSLILPRESSILGHIQTEDRPNIILILFDTLSACNLSLYGYPRNSTPNLSRFAEHATVYHSHYSAGNFTTPGVASLLTGTYPWTHRAFNLASTVKKEIVPENLFSLFGSSYNRFAFTQNPFADLFLSQFDPYIEFKLDVGAFSKIYSAFNGIQINTDACIAYKSFDDFLFTNAATPGSFYLAYLRRKWLDTIINKVSIEYRNSFPSGIPNVPGLDHYFFLKSVIDGAINSIRNLSSPSLVYLHFYPPHESFLYKQSKAPPHTYTPRSDYIGIFSNELKIEKKKEHFFSKGIPSETLYNLRQEYDEYIAYTDAEFGRLYDFLDQAGFLKNSYVIVTSDHGQLLERGVHGHDTPLLFDPVIRIPLIISRPEQSERKDVLIPTSSTDILPTLLYLSGKKIPNDCEGYLLPGLGGTNSTSRRIFAVEAKESFKYRPFSRATFMMIQDRYKFIYYLGYPGFDNQFELYDLQNDPEEMEDLSLVKSKISQEMGNLLEMKIREVNSPYLNGS